MKLDRTYLLALVLGTALGLLSIHLGAAAKIPVVAGSMLVVFVATLRPGFGIIAAFPLLVTIHPTPTELGWRELSFAGVLVATMTASVLRGRLELWRSLWRIRYWVVLAAALIFANVLAAGYHQVNISDWLRGIAPFAFLGFAVPIYLESRRDARIVPWVVASLVSASFLFCWLVLSYYISEQLWRPYHYVMNSGKWVRIDPDLLVSSSSTVFEFRARVTQVLQQATDVLLPAAFLWGAGLMLWGRRAIAWGVGAPILTVSMVAIILTYTRSMLLAALLATALLMVARLRQPGALTRVLGIALLSAGSAVVTILAFDLVDIYLNRYLLLRQAFDYIAQHLPSIADLLKSEGSARGGNLLLEGSARGGNLLLEGSARGGNLLPDIKDENVTSRLEEYRIAFSMFLDSPVFGQGLGVRHEIAFATGHGDVINVDVGYVHNWVFYFLMVGGIFGVIVWSAVLGGPALVALWRKEWPPELRWPLIATMFLFAAYGLFFAVFRLIPYNLALAGIWGVVMNLLAGQRVLQEERV